MRGMLCVCFVLVFSTVTWAAESPQGIGGFILGKSILDQAEKVDMDSALVPRYLNCVKEVEINPIAGFKSGLVTFGACDCRDLIIRIKLKYADSSKKFFEELFARLKKRYGEPHEWRGDPFHVVVAWKWSFVNRDNQNISLIIQHNTKDTDEKMGNAIKITNTTLMQTEKDCYSRSHPGEKPTKPEGKATWDELLPQ